MGDSATEESRTDDLESHIKTDVLSRHVMTCGVGDDSESIYAHGCAREFRAESQIPSRHTCLTHLRANAQVVCSAVYGERYYKRISFLRENWSFETYLGIRRIRMAMAFWSGDILHNAQSSFKGMIA